ncbi:hypothetical protein MBLNU230_g3543t1 [Neophaeotheca triangularis]
MPLALYYQGQSLRSRNHWTPLEEIARFRWFSHAMQSIFGLVGREALHPQWLEETQQWVWVRFDQQNGWMKCYWVQDTETIDNL